MNQQQIEIPGTKTWNIVVTSHVPLLNLKTKVCHLVQRWTSSIEGQQESVIEEHLTSVCGRFHVPRAKVDTQLGLRNCSLCFKE